MNANVHCVEGVDGETLLMLVTMGSMEQYKACGLATVKDQMKLRKLIGDLSDPGPSTETSSQSSASQSSASSHTGTQSRGKLNKKMLKELTLEDKRVYLMMQVIYKSMHVASLLMINIASQLQGCTPLTGCMFAPLDI